VDALRLPLNPRRTQEFGWGGGGFGGGSCPWLLVGGVALALGSLVAWRGSRWFPLPCPALPGLCLMGACFPRLGCWVGLAYPASGVGLPCPRLRLLPLLGCCCRSPSSHLYSGRFPLGGLSGGLRRSCRLPPAGGFPVRRSALSVVAVLGSPVGFFPRPCPPAVPVPPCVCALRASHLSPCLPFYFTTFYTKISIVFSFSWGGYVAAVSFFFSRRFLVFPPCWWAVGLVCALWCCPTCWVCCLVPLQWWRCSGISTLSGWGGVAAGCSRLVTLCPA